jgi:hypothetical protein
MHRLIPPTKQYPRQPIELLELHWRRRVQRHDAHDGRLHERRRAEVVLPDVHEVVHLGVELHIRGEAAPQRSSGARNEAQRELALEHEDRDTEQRAMREEAEDEGGGDLVGRVGDADVEVGKGRFDEVTDHDFELALLGPGLSMCDGWCTDGWLRLTFPVPASSALQPCGDPSPLQ